MAWVCVSLCMALSGITMQVSVTCVWVWDATDWPGIYTTAAGYSQANCGCWSGAFAALNAGMCMSNFSGVAKQSHSVSSRGFKRDLSLSPINLALYLWVIY